MKFPSAILALIALIACGCTATNDAEQVGATASTTAARSFPDFDVCAVLDDSFRQAHDLDRPRPFTDSYDPYRWVGCTYATSQAGIQISVTNGTVDEAIAKNFSETVQLTVNGRRAVRYDDAPDIPNDCTLFVEVEGGALDISLVGNTDIDPCQTAIDMAIDVEPLLPN